MLTGYEHWKEGFTGKVVTSCNPVTVYIIGEKIPESLHV
jgi:hypothetical protein